jgi:hypothetical protein
MFDNIYLVKENNENANIFHFFIFQFEDNLLFKNESKYLYNISSIFDKYLRENVVINIHIAIIYGPDIPAIDRFPGHYCDLNFHPLRIFLSALQKDEIFATMNKKMELGLQFSLLDMLNVLMLPKAVKPFDYDLLRDCLTYLTNNELIDANLKHDFVNIVKDLYRNFLDQGQWNNLLKETKMDLYTYEITWKARQESQREKMRELAIDLLQKGRPLKEVRDILNMFVNWIQEDEKTELGQ